MNKDNQDIKRDAGKPELSLVPMKELLYAVAEIREYGTYEKGYGKESWRDVSIERYIDALLRHAVAFADDPYGVDEESGYPHIDHIACNVAFLLELMKCKLAELRELREDIAKMYDGTTFATPNFIYPNEQPNFIYPNEQPKPKVFKVEVGDSQAEPITTFSEGSANAMLHNDK